MRFDKLAKFVKITGETYDPTLGEMVAERQEESFYCSVRSMDLALENEVFGQINSSSLIFVVKGKRGDYDSIEYEGKSYEIVKKEKYRNKTGYIAREI